MNQDLEIILNVCEKPVIVTTDSLPVINGNIFTICTSINSQGGSFPVVINTEESLSAVSNTTVTPNNTLSNNKPPVVSLKQLTSSVVTENKFTETWIFSDGFKSSCKVCGKNFTRYENLMFHEQTHDNSNLFRCNTCSKSFSTSKSLIDHLTTHQLKEKNVSDETLEKCEICGKYFHKSCITEHENQYKSQLMFHCRFCEQSFLKRGLLIYHLKLHLDKENETTKLKNQKCEVCLETFSQDGEKSLSNQKKSTTLENLNLETPPVLKKQPSQRKRRRRGRASNRSYKMPTLQPEIQNTDVNLTDVNLTDVNLTDVNLTDVNLTEVNLTEVNLTEVNVDADINRSSEEDKGTGSQDNCTDEPIIISDDENDTSLTKQQGLTFRNFFNCEICLKSFSSNKQLLTHCKSHLEFQCTDCGQYFNRVFNMLQHEEVFHKVQCYSCIKCNKNITLKLNFIEHILSHSSKILQVCKVCSLYLFQKHPKLVTRFKLSTVRKAFQCDICCKILQTVNVENLQCRICSALFMSKQLLKDHQERYSLSNVRCIKCNKYFHSVKGFNLHKAETNHECIISHKRHIFTNKSDFNCLKCFMEFLSPEDLQDHCFDMEHYKCSNCEEKFSDWESFSSHLVFYPLIHCRICKLFVLGKYSFEKHKRNCCSQVLSASMESLMNLDENKNLLCIVCNDTFSKKECLVEHIIFLH